MIPKRWDETILDITLYQGCPNYVLRANCGPLTDLKGPVTFLLMWPMGLCAAGCLCNSNNRATVTQMQLSSLGQAPLNDSKEQLVPVSLHIV